MFKSVLDWNYHLLCSKLLVVFYMDRWSISRQFCQILQLILGVLLLSQTSLLAQPVGFAWEYDFGDANQQEANLIADDTLTNTYVHGGRFNGTLQIGDSTFVNPNNYNSWLGKTDYDGNILWTLHFPAINPNRINDVVVDEQSNIYVTGNYTGTISIIGILGTSYALTSQGNEDIFVAKFNSDGEVLWANTFGGTGQDIGNDLAYHDGFIYLTGGFSGSFVFGAPPAVNSTNGLDAYLVKLDTLMGTRDWLRQGSCNGDAFGTAVDVDANGAYFTGSYDGGALQLDGFGGSLPNFGFGGANPFVAAYVPGTGNTIWQTWLGTLGDANSVDLIVAPNGNVHVFGNLSGTLQFPGVIATFTLDAIGQSDVWKATFNPINGNPLNGADHGGPGRDSLWDASLNQNGEFTWAITTDDSFFFDIDTILPVNQDLVVLRTVPVGGSLWAISATGPNQQKIQGLTALRSEIGLNGYFNNVGTFSPFTSAHAGGDDLFLAKLGCPSTRSPNLDTLAGSDMTICMGASTLADADTLSGFTGSWSPIPGPPPPTLADPGLYNTLIIPNGIANFALEWRLNQGSCTLRDTVEFTIAMSLMADAGPDTSLCDTFFTLQGNDPLPASGTWILDAGTGTFANASLYNTQVTGLSVGMNTFIWILNDGVCIDRDTVNLFVYDPNTATAGSDSVVCQANIELYAANPAPRSGTWTQLSGPPAIITSPTAFNSPLTLAPGITVLQWEVTDGSCSVFDTLSLEYIVPVPAQAGLDSAICGTTFTLSGNDPTPATGFWNPIGGTAAIATPNDPNAGVTGLTPGNNLIEWVVTTAGSCVERDTINLTTALLIPADAGQDSTVCQGSGYTLNGNVPLPGTGEWMLLSGNATLGDSSQSNSGITFTTPGNLQLSWEVTVAGCISTDTLNLIYDTLPFVDPGPNLSICADSITLNANNPTPFTGMWSIAVGTGNFSSLTSPTPVVTNLAYGLNQFDWTVDNGNCSVSSSVFIATDTAVPAIAFPDTSFCGDSIDIMGNTALFVSGGWLNLGGTGSIGNPFFPSTYVNNLDPGPNTFGWVLTRGGCSDTSVITINSFQDPSPAQAGTDIAICNDTFTTLNAIPPLIGTGGWTGISPLSGALTDSTLANSDLTGLQVGSTAYQWQVENGPCPVSQDSVMVTVTKEIPALAGLDQTLCDTTGTSLTGSSPVPGSGEWTLVVGSVPLATAPSLAYNNLINGDNLFAWTITDGPCVTSDTVNVNLTLSTSTVDAGLDQQLCGIQPTNLTGGDPSPGSGIWTTSSSASAQTSTSPTSLVSNLSLGISEFIWTVTEGNCIYSDTAAIEVFPTPTVSNAGVDQVLCDTFSTILSASDPNGSIGLWTSGAGVNFVTASDTNATVSGLSPGVNPLYWATTLGPCSDTDTVLITVDIRTLLPDAGPDFSICQGDSAPLNGSTPPVGASIAWSLVNGSGSIDDPTDINTFALGLPVGTQDISLQFQENSCLSFDTVNVDVLAIPFVDAGPDQRICENDSALLTGFPFSGLMGFWTDPFNNAVFDAPDSNITSVSNLQSGANLLVLEVLDGPCSVQDTVSIQVDAIPSAANAGPDQTVFGFTTDLAANTPLIGIGTWTSPGTGATWSDANLPDGVVSNLGTGFNTLSWTISNGVCPASTDSMRVEVLNFVVPSGFSPNGDGRNDTWVLRGIESYGPAQVIVFNRWENVVFQSDNYQNDWQGINAAGSPLADDTYFYLLNLSDGREFKGYVVIKR